MAPALTFEEKLWRALLRVSCVLAVLFLIVPILIVIPLSFTSGTLLTYPLPGLSWQYYAEFLSSPLWLPAANTSLWIASVTALISTALGTLAAIGLTKLELRRRILVFAFLVAPLPIPQVITAVAFFFFFAELNLTGTSVALVLAHTVIAVPFVVITVTATLQGYDFTMSRAAASLGAPPLVAFRRVMLPLIAPGIVTGALFAFITSFDELIIALFLSGPRQYTLPRQIYSGVRDSINPTIAVVATLLILLSGILVGALELLRRRAEKSGSPRTRPL